MSMGFIGGKLGKQKLPHTKSYQEGYLLPVLPAATLLKPGRYQGLLADVEAKVVLDTDDFARFYKKTVENYAEMVQMLPRQLNGALGGLLNMGLGRASLALQALGDETDPLYQYAVYTAGLFSEISRVYINQMIMLTDERGEVISNWSPFSGALVGRGEFFKCYGISSTYQRLRNSITPLLARQLLPEEGFLWLSSDPIVFSDWLDALQGNTSQGGKVSLTLAMVRRDDLLELVGTLNPPPVEITKPEANEQGEIFFQWLKKEIETGKIKINRADSGVHCVTEGVFIEPKKLFTRFSEYYTMGASFNIVLLQLGTFLGGPDVGLVRRGHYHSEYSEPHARRRSDFTALGSHRKTVREGLVIDAALIFKDEIPAATKKLHAIDSASIASSRHRPPKAAREASQLNPKSKSE